MIASSLDNPLRKSPLTIWPSLIQASSSTLPPLTTSTMGSPSSWHPVLWSCPGMTHDGAGSVAHQHVVGDPDLQLPLQGWTAWAPVKTPVLPASVPDRSMSLCAKLPHGTDQPLLLVSGHFVDERVFRRQDTEGGSKEGIRACCEDLKSVVRALNGKAGVCSFRFPDAIARIDLMDSGKSMSSRPSRRRSA